MTMFLGHDRNLFPLEVGMVVRNGERIIVPVMPMRRRFLSIYRSHRG